MRPHEAVISSNAIPARRRRLVFFHAATSLVDEAKVVLRFDDTLVGRLLEPKVGLEKILPHAAPGRIHVTDVELRGLEALLGREEVILESLLVVGLGAATEFVGEPEIKLRGRESLFRRALIPTQRLSEILFHAHAIGVGIAEGILGFRVALVRPLLDRGQVNLGTRGRLGTKQNGQPERGKQADHAQHAG